MAHILLIIIYIAFISLGLPDALLGSCWPIMHEELNVPLSYAGLISFVITIGTIISSLMSERLTYKFGTSKVTAFSILLTAIALFGFSISGNFWLLILFSIPYGIGAGGVDASLNNYVALHYSSKHMSFLHAMWGVGTCIGPNIMSMYLLNGNSWNSSYLTISIFQIVLSIVVIFSIPIWKVRKEVNTNEKSEPIKLKDIFKVKGVKEVLITFFCYCALEQTAILWSSSYLVEHFDVNKELAASLASLFLIGITVGRFISGFMSVKFNDNMMIRIGLSIISIGVILLFIPNVYITFIGLILIGLGCAPIYPSIIHSTPIMFGKDKSQAIIGVEMAFAYIGVLLMPPLFGVIATYIDISLFTLYLFIILVVMILIFELCFATGLRVRVRPFYKDPNGTFCRPLC